MKVGITITFKHENGNVFEVEWTPEFLTENITDREVMDMYVQHDIFDNLQEFAGGKLGARRAP